MPHGSCVASSMRVTLSIHKCETRFVQMCETYMYEPCHTWAMWHGASLTHTYLSHTYIHVSYIHTCLTLTYLSHTSRWIMFHMIHTNGCLMSHVWKSHALRTQMSHVTHMQGSCHVYEYIFPQICMRCAAHVNASCHTNAWVMSHTWMHRVKYMNTSPYSHEWNKTNMHCNTLQHTATMLQHPATHCSETRQTYLLLSMRQSTHANESCHTCGWVALHTRAKQQTCRHASMSQVAPTNTSWHTYG